MILRVLWPYVLRSHNLGTDRDMINFVRENIPFFPFDVSAFREKSQMYMLLPNSTFVVSTTCNLIVILR